jgi:hypothetical protein
MDTALGATVRNNMAEHTSTNAEREEKALRALIVTAFWLDGCEDDQDASSDKDYSSSLSAEDRAALEGLGVDLVDRIVAGDEEAAVSENNTAKQNRPQMVGMNRSQDCGDLSAEARAEMERKIEEAQKQKPKDLEK